MTPRNSQRQSRDVGLSQDQDYDKRRFVSFSTMMMFNSNLQLRRVISERGFVGSNAYFEIMIQQKGWRKFASHPPTGVGRVVREVCANFLHHREHTC